MLPPLSNQETATPAHPDHFDLFLLVGQSNMAGRGQLTEEDKVAAPRVLSLDKDLRWMAKGEPVHFDKAEAGVGLGFTFAKLVASANPSITAGLIPCAVGGTSMEQWESSGALYANAIHRSKIAMSRGVLKAILWHQGEAEAGSEALASAYLHRLTTLINSLRIDLAMPQVPFIAGELGRYLYERSKSPFAWRVNEQIRELPSCASFTAVVSSQGLKDKGDQLHFDAASLKEFGRRYYKALTDLQG